jgi:hypothetical protein
MGAIPAFTYYSHATNATTFTGTAIPLGYDGIDGCAWSMEWNFDAVHTLAGTFTIEASNDPRAMPTHPDTANADWDDITSLLSPGPTNPAGTAGDATLIINNTRFEFIRLVFTKTAGAPGGTGGLRVHFSGHGSSVY